MAESMKNVDILISPTVASDIPRIDEVHNVDSITEYANDYFTVPSSVAGTPCVCIPGNKLGQSIKVWGKFGQDLNLLSQARLIDKLIDN